jgi:1-acyl-sn-glycerol-3-phosphate acyltransferase
MALNSGVYWPKHKWRKHAGRVVFEFLPPILPGGEPKETMARLEEQLEAASARLRDEARAGMKH